MKENIEENSSDEKEESVADIIFRHLNRDKE